MEGVSLLTWKQLVMYAVGIALIMLAIRKEYEPSLLLPMGFGAILVNLPLSGVLNQVLEGAGETQGVIEWLFHTTIEASEVLPVLLFIGIGAMIDFGPLLANPKLFLFGAGAQFGIFAALILAAALGFDLKDAASIAMIGAADGPTSILVSQILKSNYVGAIAVAAYSYMALVPIIQPAAVKLVTSKEERKIRMRYEPSEVSRKVRIAFPIVCTFIVGLIAPSSVALVGFLMFGNLIRECGVLNTMSQTAQNEFDKSDHAIAWHNNFVSDAGRIFRCLGNTWSNGSWIVCICHGFDRWCASGKAFEPFLKGESQSNDWGGRDFCISDVSACDTENGNGRRSGKRDSDACGRSKCVRADRISSCRGTADPACIWISVNRIAASGQS